MTGNIPTPHPAHILPALVFATQSPYSPCQTVAYSRNIMRNTRKFFKIFFNQVPSAPIGKIMFLNNNLLKKYKKWHSRSNEPPRGKRALARRGIFVSVEIIYVVRSGKEII
jgi:hypothetical protein